MSGPQQDVILQELISERNAFAVFSRDKLAQMDSGIKARLETLEGFQFKGLEVRATKTSNVPDATRQVDDTFSKMSYPVMVHHVLSLQPERQPMTASDILEVMISHGVEPEANDPRNTVKTALNRRKDKIGDVVHTGLGEWGLKSWYSDSDLKKFTMGLDGSNGRDAKRHIEKTKKGIAALKARGSHYGKPPRITEEMWNLAIRLFADEGRSISYVHEKIVEMTPEGETPIVKSGFSNRKKQFMAREPYPARWKAYFEQKTRQLEAKASVDAGDTELRLIK